MAHQHLDQLPPGLRSGVVANARSRVSFSLGAKDAGIIAATSGGLLEPADYEALPAYHAYAQLLTRGATAPPVSITTTPLEPERHALEAVRWASRERYGRPRSEVDAELLDVLDGTTTRPPGASNPDNDDRTASGTPPAVGPMRPGRVRRTPNPTTNTEEAS